MSKPAFEFNGLLPSEARKAFFKLEMDRLHSPRPLQELYSAASSLPPALAQAILARIYTHRRDGLRMLLTRDWGFDPDRDAGTRLLSNWHAPLGLHECRSFLVALATFAYCDSTLIKAARLYQGRIESDGDPYPDLLALFKTAIDDEQAFIEFFIAQGYSSADGPEPEVVTITKLYARDALAAWCRSQISPARNPRLWHAARSAANTDDINEALAGLLPGAVAEAIASREPTERFSRHGERKRKQSFVRRVTLDIEHLGSRSNAISGTRDNDDKWMSIVESLSSDDDLIESFILREEVERESSTLRMRLIQLADRTRLTKRERQIFDLDREGLTTADIASRIDRSAATVRVHRMNGLNKIKLMLAHERELASTQTKN